MTRRTVVRGPYSVRQDITKPVSRIFTFEDAAPVGEVMPLRSDTEFAAIREVGDTQEFTGAERDSQHVLRLTTNDGAYSDTHFYIDPSTLLSNTGRLDIFARGYVRNAGLTVTWASHGVFASFILYIGDDAFLTHYNHTRNDPIDYLVHYEPQTVTAGWHNIRARLDFDASEIKSKYWAGNFADEPEAWVREMPSSEFNGDELSVADVGWIGAGGGATVDGTDYEWDLAYFGFEVTL